MKKRAFSLIALVLFLSTLGFKLNSGMSATGYDFVVVGYWKFDEDLGIMAFDNSGYGNDGELINGPTWVTGISGTALRFDGVNDHVNISDSASLDITSNIRIEAWINPDINDELMNIVSKRGLLGNYSYTLNMGVLPHPDYPENGNPGTHPGKIGFLWAPGGTPATEQYLVSNTVIPTGTWTNITAVYDGSYVEMYIDGSLDNSTSYTGSLYAGNADLFIGHAADNSPHCFDGVIDEVKISRTFPYYEATIKAYCYIEGADVNVFITMDGTPTGFTTPHTFTKTGTHTFTVPSADANGHPFYRWSTGLETTTIIVSTAGTYTAYYGDPFPIERHDVAVTNVTSSRNIAHQGSTMVDIYVEVRNEGTFSETFSVATYYNSTLLGNQTVTLALSTNTILAFSWNTTEVSYGYYILSANASQVLGETDLTDNHFINGIVIVTVPGDIDGDGNVDLDDLYYILIAYGTSIGDPDYNSNADINGDGEINLDDLYYVLWNYGT